MKYLALLCALGMASACSIAPTKEAMKEYAYTVEKSDDGGVVTYMDQKLLQAKKQPKEFAEVLMSEHCPSGYKVTRELTEQKARHFAHLSAMQNWITLHYQCES